MEFLLNRYRNLSVLLVAILAQLVLLAYQVKSSQEVRLIRVWSVTAVTPLARVIETVRSSASHFFSDYFVLLDVREENKRMKQELDRAHMENQYLRAQLSTADRARSLAIFQTESRSKTLAAHVIGNDTSSSGTVVLVDRGSGNGVQRGMAVETPDGIVGKVISVYPTTAFVMLITDPTFAAGVISEKNRVHGTLKGRGYGTVTVEHVQNEDKVEQGEMFLTSGDDLIFPKGIPAGEVTVVRNGKANKEITLAPSGLQNGLEDVLIIIEGVHAPIPNARPLNEPVRLLTPPPSDDEAPAVSPTPGKALSTDADRILERYRRIGEQEKHAYGDRGSNVPNYNIDPVPKPDPAQPPAK